MNLSGRPCIQSQCRPVTRHRRRRQERPLRAPPWIGQGLAAGTRFALGGTPRIFPVAATGATHIESDISDPSTREPYITGSRGHTCMASLIADLNCRSTAQQPGWTYRSLRLGPGRQVHGGAVEEQSGLWRMDGACPCRVHRGGAGRSATTSAGGNPVRSEPPFAVHSSGFSPGLPDLSAVLPRWPEGPNGNPGAEEVRNVLAATPSRRSGAVTMQSSLTNRQDYNRPAS